MLPIQIHRRLRQHNSKLYVHNPIKVFIYYYENFYGDFCYENKTFHKKKILVVFLVAFILILYLIGRLVYLMVFDAEYYQQKAEDLHERERDIKAARGEIIDRNGTVLATNRRYVRFL